MSAKAPGEMFQATCNNCSSQRRHCEIDNGKASALGRGKMSGRVTPHLISVMDAQTTSAHNGHIYIYNRKVMRGHQVKTNPSAKQEQAKYGAVAEQTAQTPTSI